MREINEAREAYLIIISQLAAIIVSRFKSTRKCASEENTCHQGRCGGLTLVGERVRVWGERRWKGGKPSWEEIPVVSTSSRAWGTGRRSWARRTSGTRDASNEKKKCSLEETCYAHFCVFVRKERKEKLMHGLFYDRFLPWVTPCRVTMSEVESLSIPYPKRLA